MTPKDIFEILIREQAGMLTVYLRSLIRDPGLVDDVFQETLIVAWRKLDQYDKSRPFGPWLRGIAGRLVLAARRRQAKSCLLCDEDILDHLEVQTAALAERSGDTLDQKLESLRECLADLPDHYREAIQGRYADEDVPCESLAERLSIPIETLKKRLQRGRVKLLECLQGKLGLAEVQS